MFLAARWRRKRKFLADMTRGKDDGGKSSGAFERWRKEVNDCNVRMPAFALNGTGNTSIENSRIGRGSCAQGGNRSAQRRGSVVASRRGDFDRLRELDGSREAVGSLCVSIPTGDFFLTPPQVRETLVNLIRQDKNKAGLRLLRLTLGEALRSRLEDDADIPLIDAWLVIRDTKTTTITGGVVTKT